ncbi:MAG: DUF932 domain-containing protein, partial [Acidobacteria bacterium]|nr:DUF932 domain-containing protein [Acidobacteriota bacterium]
MKIIKKLAYGGTAITRQELDLIQIPPKTETYTPISHFELANRIATVSQDMLSDYVMIGESYGIARSGNQLFAVLNFQGESKEMAMSVAFRNSYDKSLSFGLAFGSTVFVCDNLALTGDIVVMRKHSKTIMDTLDDLIIANIFRARQAYQKILFDSDKLKRRPLQDKQAFAVMGLLFGQNLVSPRQLTKLRQEWERPSYEEFQNRNAWSFLNCYTDCLKTTPPLDVMERNAKGYQLIN